MTTKALGLIETIGLVAAIEAADSAVKAANVKLLGYENTKGGGRITIKIVGDVGAVKAAVSAGAAAGQRIGRVESCLVIPRPHHEIEALIGQIDRGPLAVAAAAPALVPEAAPSQEVAAAAPSPAPPKPKAAKPKAVKPKAPAPKAKPAPGRRSKAKPAAPPVEEEHVVLLGPPAPPAPAEEPLPPAESNTEQAPSPTESDADQPTAE